jgi:trehalose 6-phosphate phosphatase
MQVLTPSLDYGNFIASIAKAPARVLLLDYDGTLAPFRVHPGEARPYPEVIPVLKAVMRAGGTRVVIVSGRPAAELPPLLALDERPEIWGSHGWERLQPDGTTQLEQPRDEERRALDEAARVVTAAVEQGARMERKLASIAMHWRGLVEDEARACREVIAHAWSPYTSSGTLALLEFDGGLELRAPGCNKQHAVKAILATTPSDAAIAYLGDDMTDEDAFRAIKARGVSVLVRSEYRPTDADIWLRPPADLVTFLEHWRVDCR